MRKHQIEAILFVATLAACAGTSTGFPAPSTSPVPTMTVISQPTAAPAATQGPGSSSPAATETQGSGPPLASTTFAAAPSTISAPTPTATPSVARTRVAPPAAQVNLPPGFGISVFASGLATPRNLAIGQDGQLYVVARGAGQVVRLPDLNHDGLSDGLQVVAGGLDSPSSLAFYKDGSLYVSTPTQVFRLSQPDANGAFQKRDLLIDGLPSRQGHFTRTLLFSPDWSFLFIQVGSSCNACIESDPRRATIMRFNPDGSGGEIYARGLRNAVGITFRPGTNELWATNNGSDYLGADQPADTVLSVQQGVNYGWPQCEAGIVDPLFGAPGACSGILNPPIHLQAHSAALGLTFYDGTQFPAEYRGDIFVAMHGSIYRTVPTGYKVVRIHFTNGQPGPAQDFATGWLTGAGKAWGRPADVLTGPDGSLFVSDDSGGIIYRIFYASP